jgi:hypothetical protein
MTKLRVFPIFLILAVFAGVKTKRSTFVNIVYRPEMAKLKIYDGTYMAYDRAEAACDRKKFVVYYSAIISLR